MSINVEICLIVPDHILLLLVLIYSERSNGPRLISNWVHYQMQSNSPIREIFKHSRARATDACEEGHRVEGNPRGRIARDISRTQPECLEYDDDIFRCCLLFNKSLLTRKSQLFSLGFDPLNTMHRLEAALITRRIMERAYGCDLPDRSIFDIHV